eukprot:2569846-Pleurochrysis_carterae.AAC.1
MLLQGAHTASRRCVDALRLTRGRAHLTVSPMICTPLAGCAGAHGADGGCVLSSRLQHRRLPRDGRLEPVPRHLPRHVPAHFLHERRLARGHPARPRLQRRRWRGACRRLKRDLTRALLLLRQCTHARCCARRRGACLYTRTAVSEAVVAA